MFPILLAFILMSNFCISYAMESTKKLQDIERDARKRIKKQLVVLDCIRRDKNSAAHAQSFEKMVYVLRSTTHLLHADFGDIINPLEYKIPTNGNGKKIKIKSFWIHQMLEDGHCTFDWLNVLLMHSINVNVRNEDQKTIIDVADDTVKKLAVESCDMQHFVEATNISARLIQYKKDKWEQALQDQNQLKTIEPDDIIGPDTIARALEARARNFEASARDCEARARDLSAWVKGRTSETP